jgi:hypothetical protein
MNIFCIMQVVQKNLPRWRAGTCHKSVKGGITLVLREPSPAGHLMPCSVTMGGGGEEKVHSKLLYLKILLYS